MASERDNNQSGSRRGSVEQDTGPRFLVIGEILKPHGVHGEVRVLPHTDSPERFTWLEAVYVGKQVPQRFVVENVRFHKNLVLIKFVDYDNRDMVEALRGAWLQVPESEAVPLEEDEYFLFQLIGLAVYSVDGEHLGALAEVIETGANNVFVVRGSSGELLVPDTAEVVAAIDFENGRMTINLLPGLR